MKRVEIEIGKYRKKKKSDTSKISKKAKHKHEYEDCLLLNNKHPYPAKVCKICNKITDIKYFVTEKRYGGYWVLSDEQVYEKYRDLKQIEWDGE